MTQPDPDLRDRIAEAALSAVEAALDDTLLPAAREKALAGIAAVLPAPDHRAAVLLEAADRYEAILNSTAAEHSADPRYYQGVHDVVLGLRRLAGEAQQDTHSCGNCDGIDPASCLANPNRTREAQQDPAPGGEEAHPAEHTWAAELYDPIADEWVPGTRYTVRDRAVNHLKHAKAIGPTWKDGTPTQRRLVRQTTTYTVEELTASARSGQPETDGEA
ncbi:hypothetical protein [Streptomyces sp. F-1]|uniref:hypothetical protein n=1 Tax=Streptomyces sp. F-1 TaxID=463642 RepID=UPI00085C3EC2|nr:hypothetical protein [Streptomyces sp. F-1]SFY52088.1 hypothetical protein STEPF1_05357 [Streptomyces sp. F-1]